MPHTFPTALSLQSNSLSQSDPRRQETTVDSPQLNTLGFCLTLYWNETGVGRYGLGTSQVRRKAKSIYLHNMVKSHWLRRSLSQSLLMVILLSFNY